MEDIDSLEFLEKKFKSLYQDEVVFNRMITITEVLLKVLLNDSLTKPTDKQIQNFYLKTKDSKSSFEDIAIDQVLEFSQFVERKIII